MRESRRTGIVTTLTADLRVSHTGRREEEEGMAEALTVHTINIGTGHMDSQLLNKPTVRHHPLLICQKCLTLSIYEKCGSQRSIRTTFPAR